MFGKFNFTTSQNRIKWIAVKILQHKPRGYRQIKETKESLQPKGTTTSQQKPELHAEPAPLKTIRTFKKVFAVPNFLISFCFHWKDQHFSKALADSKIFNNPLSWTRSIHPVPLEYPCFPFPPYCYFIPKFIGFMWHSKQMCLCVSVPPYHWTQSLSCLIGHLASLLLVIILTSPSKLGTKVM